MTPVTDEPMFTGEDGEPAPPVAHVRIVYLGPVAPHWEVRAEFGDPALVEEFRRRTMARLVLLPPHDPQYRRNRERVGRDAEREHIILEWDLGVPEEEAIPPPAGEGGASIGTATVETATVETAPAPAPGAPMGDSRS